ncbi:MAG TPA: NAD(P)/FAD-dependent oxidoreductase [Terriglobia bacterium]|nr:NAD(P)/FAD-dependent oxidoreductase [Terriglobia bacterium]
MTNSRLQHIVVIGGGPAGAMAAEGLARAGRRVTVFEERPGWEKPCGGGVTHKALSRYPFLLPMAGEASLVREVEFVAANNASLRFQLREPLAIYPRCGLNGLLLRRAQSAGAEVVGDRIRELRRQASGWELQGCRSCLPLDGHPETMKMVPLLSKEGAGVVSRSAHHPLTPSSSEEGSRFQSGGTHYRADYLILAAGARTRLRAVLTEDFGPHDFMLTFGYYVPGRDDLLRVQFFEEFEGYVWAFPRPSHLSVGICGKVGEDSMAGLRERLHAFMRRFGYSSEGAQVYSHLLPALSVDTWGGLRLAGPGWALAGDAGGLVDPVTGEGIYYAMRSGELLAQSLLEGLPELYPARVQDEFGRALALGARLARTFYYGQFLGGPVPTRMVEFGSRSRRFLNVIQDMIEGSQSYLRLAAKLHLGLAAAIWDVARPPGFGFSMRLKKPRHSAAQPRPNADSSLRSE